MRSSFRRFIEREECQTRTRTTGAALRIYRNASDQCVAEIRAQLKAGTSHNDSSFIPLYPQTY